MSKELLNQETSNPNPESPHSQKETDSKGRTQTKYSASHTEFKSTDVISVLGRRGCGKSTLAKSIQAAYPRRIILDTLREYTDGKYTFDEFAKDIQLSLEKSEFEIVFYLPTESDNDEIFNQAVRLVCERGDCLLVIEEVQLHSSHHSLPSHLREALLVGRHYNLALMFTSQRAGEVHKTILSQSNHIFVGQMHELNDLKYLNSILMGQSDKLINLPKFEFIYFNGSENLKIIKNNLDQNPA